MTIQAETCPGSCIATHQVWPLSKITTFKVHKSLLRVIILYIYSMVYLKFSSNLYFRMTILYNHYPIWATSCFAIQAVSEFQSGWSQCIGYGLIQHASGSLGQTQVTGYRRPGIWDQDSGGHRWSPFWGIQEYPTSGNCSQQKMCIIVMCILQHTTITGIFLVEYVSIFLNTWLAAFRKGLFHCCVDSHAESEVI